MTFTHALATNNYGESKFIVTSSAANGTHTSITAACAVASSGDTIFIRDGTYTENVTVPAGVSLVAYDSNGFTPNVTIVGKLLFTAAGSYGIAGIRLTTNSDYVIQSTGANAVRVILVNCYLNMTNNSGINITNANANVELWYCGGDITTTGITPYVMTNGNIDIKYTHIGNTGSSVTASTISAGQAACWYSRFGTPMTSSGTGGIIMRYVRIDTNSNTLALTVGGSGTHTVRHCAFSTGTATSITISQTLDISGSELITTNATAIAGAGTIIHSGLVFADTGSGISTTTQNVREMGPDMTIGGSCSGLTNTLLVTNSSNTASSAALVNISVGGTSAADAFETFTVSGTTNWSQGIDNSVTGDPFVLAASTALGTTNVMSATTAGEVTWPLQPAFLAVNTADNADVTGDGTSYTMVYATEIFDQGSDYNTGTSTFTAPVTGRYYLSSSFLADQIGAGHTSGTASIVASNRTYRYWQNNPAGVGATQVSNGSVLMDMDVNDTATCNLTIGGGTKIIDFGDGSVPSMFSGKLDA